MRNKTLASLLILCGSTAAIAQVATPQTTQEAPLNNTAVDDAMANQATPADPSADTLGNSTTTTDDAPEDTTTTTPPQG